MKATTCPIRPTVGRVVVKKAEPEKETKGGILLPDNAREDFAAGNKGVIVAIGPERRMVEQMYRIELEVGQTAYFAYHSGVRIKIGGDEFVVLDHDMVVATAEE